MERINTLVFRAARRVIPANSRARARIASAYWAYKAASTTFRAEMADRPRYNAKRIGFSSYGRWKRQQSAPRTAVVAGGVTFSIVIERTAPGNDSGVAATQASLGHQTQAPEFVVVVNPGDQPSALESDFVLYLHAGSVLRPDALAEIARMHRVDPGLKVIAFDSDERGAFGGRNPRFRPEWSPEMLVGQNYLGRAFAASASLSTALHDISDRGIWQMLLTGGLDARTVGRLPKVLLSESPRERPALVQADADMVVAALAGLGETATASIDPTGVVRVQFVPASWPTVSIVVPTRHNRANMGRFLASLATTEYPHFDLTIVDNGGFSDENVQWYADTTGAIATDIVWWTEQPFNYSRVNNVGAERSSGDVIVMLNDDTEIVNPRWLTEMVGLLMRDGVGTVGAQLRQAEGLIQHAGVTVGPGGFADNLFAGLKPGSDTLIGPTTWYRNALAVTGACVAIRRTDFVEVGGLDERFILCGSDVVLGLDQVIRGRRNTVVPFDIVRHYESLTRGSYVPPEDFYASYFRYHPWLQNGDPYLSPNVSPLSAVPRFRNKREAGPVRLALERVGRVHAKMAQSSSIGKEALGLLSQANVTAEIVDNVTRTHADNAEPLDIRTINWFIPDIDMPFFGGLNTAFRLAAKLATEHGVINRFVMLAAPNEPYVAAALAAAYPALAGSEIVFYNGDDSEVAQLPPADAAVATLWLTALHVAKAPGIKRRFYLVQDYEPMFYPASTMYAMAEESYRLGLYGISNTESMHKSYLEEYDGQGMCFVPAVDDAVFSTLGRREKADDEPVTIFAYARDHFRNCWELVFAALTEIKAIHGDKVRIVAAGARYLPPSSDFIDLGLLDYRATGDLYRETDIGVTMQISRHPSYLPLELMASGVAMVTPDSHWFDWMFVDGENSLRSMTTVSDIVAKIDALVRDAQLRKKIAAGGLATIAANHSDWDAALAGVYAFMTERKSAD